MVILNLEVVTFFAKDGSVCIQNGSDIIAIISLYNALFVEYRNDL